MSSVGPGWHIRMLWGDDRSGRPVGSWINGCIGVRKEESVFWLVRSRKEACCEWSQFVGSLYQGHTHYSTSSLLPYVLETPEVRLIPSERRTSCSCN